jgi:mRNA interferase MazF
MGAFAAGQVVLLPFPFSDLTRSKLRPALLLADAGRDEVRNALIAILQG